MSDTDRALVVWAAAQSLNASAGVTALVAMLVEAGVLSNGAFDEFRDATIGIIERIPDAIVPAEVKAAALSTLKSGT